MPMTGTDAETAARLLRVAGDYDRVVPCDEPLLSALLDAADPRALDFLTARPDALTDILDKTRFPAAASAAGLRVPARRVAADQTGLLAALDDLGLPAILKGPKGYGGDSVRKVSDPESAPAAADALGYPVLVEAFVEGALGLMPYLFERGVLVAAIAAEKRRTMKRFGPSSVNVLWEVDDDLRRVAETAGAAFGLHGFASIDLFRTPDGDGPVVIEINPRPVLQLHLGRRAGVDIARALADVLAGRFDGAPRLGTGTGAQVAMFPFELRRLRRRHGALGGTLRWLKSPGALGDVPWNDLPLAWRQAYRQH
jgi:biotin carboxylase